MEHEELVTRVHELRAEGLPPKAVARSLGLTPAQVKPLIREAAAARETDPTERPVVACLVSPGWSIGLSWDDHPEWDDNAGNAAMMGGGLVCVLLARQQRWGRVTACGYLVDVYCLGVKDAIPPRVLSNEGFAEFASQFFRAYDGDPVPVPLELARHLVFGAVDFARGLGFEPHPDFEDAAGYLGPWTGPSAITFGNDGAPLYVQGPNDDPRKIMAALGEKGVTDGAEGE